MFLHGDLNLWRVHREPRFLMHAESDLEEREESPGLFAGGVEQLSVDRGG